MTNQEAKDLLTRVLERLIEEGKREGELNNNSTWAARQIIGTASGCVGTRREVLVTYDDDYFSIVAIDPDKLFADPTTQAPTVRSVMRSTEDGEPGMDGL